jgi:hypothetical protein
MDIYILDNVKKYELLKFNDIVEYVRLVAATKTVSNPNVKLMRRMMQLCHY